MKPIKMDTASLKLIGEIMTQVFTLWMDAYSLKLIREPMIQVSSFALCTLIMMVELLFYTLVVHGKVHSGVATNKLLNPERLSHPSVSDP